MYKTIGRRTKNFFDPASKEPFALSRSKIESFLKCPRCFYIDRRLGVGQPSLPAFTLNNAVDALLKKEFDIHRVNGDTHPLMKHYGIDAVPFQHLMMDEWRETFKGVRFHHQPTNLIIFGAVDDIWVDKKGALMVVDYKATSSDGEVTLEGEYRQAYKRQMEIYQWLLRHNGFTVSNTGYFVYANGKRDKKAFDGKLEFDVQIIEYRGVDRWVEKTITDAHQCLMANGLPSSSPECEYCAYRNAAQKEEQAPRFNF
ncbi:MAG: PD-(D/E)XK nuclease family protein [Parcubacteria group bacterium]|nr:PD-(D/E)XK nuclease family protein [Parcubacteria group bacterium]